MHFDENFFYCPALSVSEAEPLLDIEESHHAINVLRLKVGDTIMVTDGSGSLYKCLILCIIKKQVRITIVEKSDVTTSTEPVFTLATSITKKTSFESMLELCGQLPVRQIIPIITDYSSKQIDFIKKGTERLDSKLVTSMKQSKKTWLTKLSGIEEFEDLVKRTKADHFPVLFEKLENNQNVHDRTALKIAPSILIFIGPEGGFSEKEITVAKKYNIPVYSLGETRLRAETAAFASIIQLLTLRTSL